MHTTKKFLVHYNGIVEDLEKKEIKKIDEVKTEELMIFIENIKVIFKDDALDTLTDELKNKIIEFLNKKLDYFKQKGIKKIEINTIYGFYLENKTRGNFLMLTSKHAARLLKK
jgi:hypothetical protein